MCPVRLEGQVLREGMSRSDVLFLLHLSFLSLPWKLVNMLFFCFRLQPLSRIPERSILNGLG